MSSLFGDLVGNGIRFRLAGSLGKTCQILSVCNAYNIRAKVGQSELLEVVSMEIRKLPSPLVRRRGPGIVLLEQGDHLVAETMRWGFDHPRYREVNNARSDSLAKPRGMWREPLDSGHRCLVPVSSFYEWGEAVHGIKPAFEFSRPDGEWLWIAGLYERKDSGSHYATITTEPTEQVAKFHDRLLAIVEFQQGLEFLQGADLAFQPYAGELNIVPCESPLRVKKQSSQEELF